MVMISNHREMTVLYQASIFLCIDTVLDTGNRAYYTELEELKAKLERRVWDACFVYLIDAENKGSLIGGNSSGASLRKCLCAPSDALWGKRQGLWVRAVKAAAAPPGPACAEGEAQRLSI